MNNLFTYGSLMDPDVFQLVTGEIHHGKPAEISGFSRYCIHGESYPALVRSKSGQVDGILYENISAQLLDQLDAFEGDEYERISIIMDSENIVVELYLYREEKSAKINPTPWSFRHFLDYEKERFLRRCRETSCQNTRFVE